MMPSPTGLDILQMQKVVLRNSDDSWPLEKTLTIHNVLIHIKLVWNKDQNHCYYNKFLEKF